MEEILLKIAEKVNKYLFPIERIKIKKGMIYIKVIKDQIKYTFTSNINIINIEIPINKEAYIGINHKIFFEILPNLINNTHKFSDK